MACCEDNMLLAQIEIWRKAAYELEEQRKSAEDLANRLARRVRELEIVIEKNRYK